MASPLCLLLLLGLSCCIFFSMGWASHMVFNTRDLCSSSSSSMGQPKQPYRSAFHFQPPSNWMNDPAGLMYFKGDYHLFYQYNPYAAVWGNITWGHAVSTNLLHWHILELALVPSEWYDLYGCWTGSSTLIQADKPVILYTGWTNVSFNVDNQQQVQAMAVPLDYSDPMLRKWTKLTQNPILKAPSDINSTKFRDPTTGWIGPDGQWRMLIGSRRNRMGLALLYRSMDFLDWQQAEQTLYSIPLSGMWECVDFYPVLIGGKHGLDTSIQGPNILHVLKFSLDETKKDHYVVGAYVASNDSFLPVNSISDASMTSRYDYGKFYASKSFYDSKQGRRILFGWINESSSYTTDIAKGWASLMSFPRMVWLDGDTNSNLLQWPIDEVGSLHRTSTSLGSFLLDSGSVFEVKGINATQLDVEVEFELSSMSQVEAMDVNSSNAQMICSGIGASRRGVLGPFGLLVLVSDDFTEQTALFFYVVSNSDGLKALVCSDQSRSSLAMDVDKTSYGSYISVTENEASLRLRALVDHSIVETFAQGGKVCITSRVYPTKAIYDQAHLYVFNNGSIPIQLKNLTAWNMAAIMVHAT